MNTNKKTKSRPEQHRKWEETQATTSVHINFRSPIKQSKEIETLANEIQWKRSKIVVEGLKLGLPLLKQRKSANSEKTMDVAAVS